MQSEQLFEQLASEFLHLMVMTRHMPVPRHARDLSFGEKGMLGFLSEHPDGITAGEIAKALEIGSGGVANTLNALEKKGLIVRSMNPNDRRSVVVCISPEGLKHIQEKHQEVHQMTVQMLKMLGEQDAQDLVRITRRILELGQKYMQEHNCCEGG